MSTGDEPTLAVLINRYNLAYRRAIAYDAEVLTPTLHRLWADTSTTFEGREGIRKIHSIVRAENADHMNLVDLCMDDIESHQIRVLRLHDIPWIAISGLQKNYEDIEDYVPRMNMLTSNVYAHDPRIRIGGVVASDAMYRLLFGQKYQRTPYLTLAKVNYAWHEMTDGERAMMNVQLAGYEFRGRVLLNEAIHMYEDVDNYHMSGGSRYMADLDGIGKSVANLIAQYMWPGSKEQDIDDAGM